MNRTGFQPGPKQSNQPGSRTAPCASSRHQPELLINRRCRAAQTPLAAASFRVPHPIALSLSPAEIPMAAAAAARAFRSRRPNAWAALRPVAAASPSLPRFLSSGLSSDRTAVVVSCLRSLRLDHHYLLICVGDAFPILV